MAIFLHRLAKSVGYLFIVKYDITLSELICHLVLLTVPALCHCHEHKRSRNSRSMDPAANICTNFEQVGQVSYSINT